jgi:hypothetical protein
MAALHSAARRAHAPLLQNAALTRTISARHLIDNRRKEIIDLKELLNRNDRENDLVVNKLKQENKRLLSQVGPWAIAWSFSVQAVILILPSAPQLNHERKIKMDLMGVVEMQDEEVWKRGGVNLFRR